MIRQAADNRTEYSDYVCSGRIGPVNRISADVCVEIEIIFAANGIRL